MLDETLQTQAGSEMDFTARRSRNQEEDLSHAKPQSRKGRSAAKAATNFRFWILD
jgi:hypothetical protein